MEHVPLPWQHSIQAAVKCISALPLPSVGVGDAIKVGVGDTIQVGVDKAGDSTHEQDATCLGGCRHQGHQGSPSCGLVVADTRGTKVAHPAAW